jgi:hypothetical protein
MNNNFENGVHAAALAAVRSLLKPGQSLADLATWADEQRDQGLEQSTLWHYVDVPITACSWLT